MEGISPPIGVYDAGVRTSPEELEELFELPEQTPICACSSLGAHKHSAGHLSKKT